MRLLITGASGLLGLNLCLQAMKTHSVVGVHRGRLSGVPFRLLQLDLLHAGSVDRALRDAQVDAVLHCAALADVDACERNPALAWRVNAELPGRIAHACSRNGLALVHVSTDAVFDGRSDGSYVEKDAPSPTSVYARTKHAAECEVLNAHPHAVVARVNFYGWSLSGRRSLAEFFVHSLLAGERVQGFTDVIFCPMLVDDLGQTLLQMLESNLAGLFHAVGPQPMSKYEFGLALARKFGLDDVLIAPDSVEMAGLPAPRAHNLNLSVHKLSTALGAPLPDFSTGLDTFFAQFAQGYPQRIRSYQQVSAGSPAVEPPAGTL